MFSKVFNLHFNEKSLQLLVEKFGEIVDIRYVMD